MTAIIGLKQDGEVWIGADSASNWNDGVTPLVKPKVLRLGAMLIGCAGTSRLNQIIEHHVEVPEYQGSPDVYLIKEFIPALRKALDEHGYMRKGEEDASGNESMDGAMMVALGGRLFQIASCFQVDESGHSYQCVGSGTKWCEGSLYSTVGLLPYDRINLALEATAEHCASVREPFDILKL